MTKKEQQPFYVSPKGEAVWIKIQSVLCQSGGNKIVRETDYGDGGFEEEL